MSWAGSRVGKGSGHTVSAGFASGQLALSALNASYGRNCRRCGRNRAVASVSALSSRAKVKTVVPRGTFDEGYAILNADDDLVYAMKEELDCNIALFSLDEKNERIKLHRQEGGLAAIIEKGYFTVCKGQYKTRIAKVDGCAADI